MTDKMTDTYEEVCETSIDALYRAAYLTLGNDTAAAQTVEDTCAACVHICANMRTQSEIRRALFFELARRCEENLFCVHLDDSALPAPIRAVDPYKRLRLAVQIAAAEIG